MAYRLAGVGAYSGLGAAGARFTGGLRVTAPEGAVQDAGIGLPKGPAIAVLPFVNLSGDLKQDVF